MRLVIEGRPTTKKNSLRIAKNKTTGKRFVMQSKQSNNWAVRAVWQIKAQARGQAFTGPVNMAAVVYRQVAAGDLLNYLAAVSDALEAAGVVENDRLIVQLDGCRLDKDADRPRVEVTLTAMEAA